MKRSALVFCVLLLLLSPGIQAEQDEYDQIVNIIEKARPDELYFFGYKMKDFIKKENLKTFKDYHRIYQRWDFMEEYGGIYWLDPICLAAYGLKTTKHEKAEFYFLLAKVLKDMATKGTEDFRRIADLAIKYAGIVAEQYPDSKFAARALHIKGEVAPMPEQQKTWFRILDKYPQDSADTINMMFRYMRNAELLLKAARVSTRYYPDYSENSFYYQRAARTFYREKKPKASVSAYLELIEKFGGKKLHPSVYKELADIALEIEEFDTARTYYKIIIDLDDNRQEIPPPWLDYYDKIKPEAVEKLKLIRSRGSVPEPGAAGKRQ